MKYLFFKKLKNFEALENTYVLSNCGCYNHNILKFYEIGLNTILTQLVSNILSTYFCDTKVVQTLYPTSHKLNIGPMVLNFYFKIFWIHFIVSIYIFLIIF